jgi:hypothetical protein
LYEKNLFVVRPVVYTDPAVFHGSERLRENSGGIMSIQKPSDNGNPPAVMRTDGAARLWPVLALAVGLWAGQASAFVSFGNGFGSKWGPDPNFGTGAVVTWGYMLDGTTADPDFRMDPANFPDSTGVIGGSNITQLRGTVDAVHGTGAFDAAIQRALDTWASAANITFVGPQTDLGQPFGSPGAIAPEIRIGAFTPDPALFFNNAGAIGYGPPGPFGEFPLSGDIIFNLNMLFDILPGQEDVTPIPFGTNDLEGLMLHELGHAAIGLGHPPWEGEDPDQRVMYVGDFNNPAAPFCCQTLNRELHPDDIAGAVFTYGLRGDLDSDGFVGISDLNIVLGNWNQNVPPGDPLADPNADGFVGIDDLNTVLGNWNAGTPPSIPQSTPAPEPITALILAAAVPGLLPRRRDRSRPG